MALRWEQDEIFDFSTESFWIFLLDVKTFCAIFVESILKFGDANDFSDILVGKFKFLDSSLCSAKRN